MPTETHLPAYIALSKPTSTDGCRECCVLTAYPLAPCNSVGQAPRLVRAGPGNRLRKVGELEASHPESNDPAAPSIARKRRSQTGSV